MSKKSSRNHPATKPNLTMPNWANVLPATDWIPIGAGL
ncbi:hypothetical protein FHT21_000761 [Pedobacter sp. SG908]|nr:hypothetical protein [Pedobacter sp. SG908]NMN35720.1 hypothetical protein [Pedobacter sp. SG918]